MPSWGNAVLQLRDAIVQDIGGRHFRAILLALGRELENEVRSDVPFPEQVQLLLIAAKRGGWLDELLIALEMERPDPNGDIVKSVRAVREAEGVVRDGWYSDPEHPWRTFFVAEGALVDRELLRRSIEEMTQPVGPRRLLLLRGMPNSGKSYSRQLFDVAKRNLDRLAYIDLVYWDAEEDEDAEVDGATLRDVSEAIASQLNISAPQCDPHTSPSRQAGEYARAVADACRAAGSRCWIFIDHLDSSSAKSEVFTLIRKLAFLAQAEGYDLRLVVAGRGIFRHKTFGQKVGGRALEEEVEVVRDADIVTYFDQLSEHVLRRPIDEPTRIQVRHKVLECINGDRHSLPRELWRVACELFRAEEGAHGR